MNIEEVIEFVRKKTEENKRPSNYKFRDRFSHIMRVYNWALKINEIECGNKEIISLAALFHDSGWDDNIPHGDVSAKIAYDFLKEHNFNESVIDEVVFIVKNHSLKNKEMSFPKNCSIVMDADLLDEVGALSIIWDSMATVVNEKDSATYYKAYRRITDYFESNSKKIYRAKTKFGRNEFKRRIEFIQNFIKEMEMEIN
ncbi:HD domain-containing protein [Clostridium sp. BJN0001]|uniref:HD domain-containing protein n=1 Tax=Clostridium sp. BJN0001 TaxID=2930219 RepID=UPI001FCFEBBB|nr:HD domain-containing protein [Clostridium sp. BJN0001]